MRPNKPLIKYLVSSPYGDIPVDKNKWHLPLEGDALKTPYKKYFYYIRDFLLQDESKQLLEAVSQNLGHEIQRKEIIEIIIRSEKHGSLYHPSSIEIIFKECRVKFALNVAISELGKRLLREEFSVLNLLNTNFNFSYLPQAYIFSEYNSISYLLEDWLEGYHEFHISMDEKGKQRLKLWDFDSGYKYLSPKQSFEIYRQASKILTLYYDLNTFRQIYPWHHAAGDFVVKIDDESNSPIPPLIKGGEGGLPSKKIDVRLTTARRYEPFIGFVENNTLNSILALCYYLLNLTIRMRLDKLDGMGEIVWADDNCVEATLTGFFEALKSKLDHKNYIMQVEDFTSLLQSFTTEELKTIFEPLIEYYIGTDDYCIIKSNLDKHVDKLYIILQNLPL